MNYHRSFVPDKQAMIALMRRAVDLGVNLFDTAEAYGPFVNEQLIGEAIEPIRKDILVCTKWSYPVFMDSFWFVFLVLVRYRSEEHTSELQSRGHLVCRLLLEKKKKK